MAASTGSTPLYEPTAADDLDGDADTEGSGSADNINESSIFDNEHSASQEKQPLSMKRRIALVGALLLCVFTVFAFAFLLPCHKPKCQKVPLCPGKGDLSSVNWTDNFSGITPGVISLVDVTGYGRPDILVEFDIVEKESKNSSFLNRLCKSKNCHGGGVLAIDGSCGNSLWVFSQNSSFGLLACEKVVERTEISNKHCLLVEEKVKLVLFNAGNGTTKWQSESPSSRKISSFKFVNDVDGDGVRDIVFVNEQKDIGKKGGINLLSGKTGQIIGGSLPLPESHSGSNILAIHAPSSAQQFVIAGSVSEVNNMTSLWAISVHDLSEKVRDPGKEIPGQPWGTHQPDPATGFISILKDSLILVQPLLADLDADGVKDVIFLIKENGISLLAMNGNDLAVMWKMVVPSAVSIHKLFQAQHSVKGNSTDVVMFVAQANHSSTVLVIDGLTGEIRWSFHSKTALPVAPIPMLGVNGMQQAFVIWLPQLEAVTLIPKPRKSRQIQQDSDGNHGEDARSVDGDASQKIRKLLQTTSDSVVKKVPRRKRRVPGDVVAEYDSVSPSEWRYHQDIASRHDHYDDSYDEDYLDSDDEDNDMVSKEFERGLLQEILAEDAGDSPLALRQFFDVLNENIDSEASNGLLSESKEHIPVIQQRGYNGEDFSPFTKNQKFLGTEEEISQEETSDEIAGPFIDTTSDLERDLSDLTTIKKDKASLSSPVKHEATISSQKKDEMTSISSHEKKETETSGKATRHAHVPREHPLPQSSPKVSKEYPPEPTREHDDENDFQKVSESDTIKDRRFLPENSKEENSKLVPAKKPSYHKRSVQSSPSGSQCVRSSRDDADSFVALLLMKDGEGKQQIAEITEESPIYLDAEDYESLFNVKKDDVKSTSCLRLVPSLLSQPVIRDTEEGLDLVYTVSFVSGDHSLHVGKVRKITMTQVFERLKSIKTTASAGKHQSKRENDYSFSFPRILK